MLKDYLHDSTIQLLTMVADYHQALQICAEPLLNRRIITADYLLAIVQQHEQLGPYYVLAPGLAMPHVRPEQGALAKGLSLLKLTQGVCFGHTDFDPVDIIVMLAAEDNHSHIDMITALSELFSCAEDMALLHQAASKKEIIHIINQY